MQRADITLLDAENSCILATLRVDTDGVYLLPANLTKNEISDDMLDLKEAGPAESVSSVETAFGVGQAQVAERTGESFDPYQPFASSNPYANYVIESNP